MKVAMRLPTLVAAVVVVVAVTLLGVAQAAQASSLFVTHWRRHSVSVL
jgi:hypothetical protein